MEYSSVQKKLESISLSQDFSQLNALKNPEVWNSWPVKQQEILASLFIQKGEKELRSSNGKAFESFHIASQIAPKNPIIFYRQGTIYAEHAENIHCLRYAAKTFETAVSLHPEYFDALYAWANTLVQLAIYLGESSYLQHAHVKFSKAHQFLLEDRSWVQAEFFWHWGKCWYTIATQAGEAVEYKRALEKYQIAAELGLNEACFWIDYGLATSDFAHLLNDPSLLLQSTEYFIKANLLDPNDFDALFYLGCTFTDLHAQLPKEAYFREADQYFAFASLTSPDCALLWLKWGILYTREGKRLQDLDRLEMSFEKFLNADACEPNNSQVLNYWAEAQIIYGSILDELEQLRSAERKIARALEQSPSDPQVWCTCGNYFNTLGRYFNEVEYFYQAIEKFEYAMTLQTPSPDLWYGLASSHYAIGDLQNHIPSLERAARCCSRAAENGGEQILHLWNDWGVALMKIAEITGNKFYVQSAIEKFKRAIGWPQLQFEKEGIQLDWVANFANALDVMGELSHDLSFYEVAIQILHKLIQIDPHHPLNHYQLATTSSHLAGFLEDIDMFEKAHVSYAYYLDMEQEDQYAWSDWGISLICHALCLRERLGHSARAYELFQEAEAKLMAALSLGFTPAFYSLACLYSLTGNQALAFEYILKTKKANILPPIDVLLSDEWLKALHQIDSFRDFIQDIPK